MSDKLVSLFSFLSPWDGELMTLSADTTSDFVPVRIHTFPMGKLKTNIPGKKLRVEASEVDALRADFSARQSEIPLLLMHGKGPKGEEAQGWLTEFSANEKGIFLSGTASQAFAASVRNKTWRYASPAVFVKPDSEGYNRPFKWLEVSATNVPVIDGMMQIAASAATLLSADDRQEDKRMISKELAAKFNLKEDATEADLLSAIESAMSKSEAKPDANASAALASLSARLDSFSSIEQKLANLEKQTAAREFNTKLDAAVESGLVALSAVEQIKTLTGGDVEKLSAFLAVVPKSGAPTGKTIKVGGKAVALADEGSKGTVREAIAEKLSAAYVLQRKQNIASIDDAISLVLMAEKA